MSDVITQDPVYQTDALIAQDIEAADRHIGRGRSGEVRGQEG